MNKRVKQAIIDRNELDRRKKELDARYTEKKNAYDSIIDEYFAKADLKSTSLSFNNANIRVTKVEQVKIEYNLEKIKKRFDDEMLEELIIKKHTVSNMQKLIELLKRFGVPSKLFKQCISKEEQLNTKRLEQLYELGEITKDDLKGCYTTTKGTTYLKFTRSEIAEE